MTNPLWCENHDHFKRTCPHCEIEQLKAEIDRLKRCGWISVKERLPEIGDTVLVYYRRGDYRGVDILRYIGRWVMADWHTEITHWMPLPEPPKEGENG